MKMTNVVSKLKPCEVVQIQPTAVSAQGDRQDDMVERLVVDVAECLGSIETAMASGDLKNTALVAKSLGIIADRAGLILLARVAGDVLKCSQRADPFALAAVVDRLERVGDASLAAAIDGACLEC